MSDDSDESMQSATSVPTGDGGIELPEELLLTGEWSVDDVVKLDPSIIATYSSRSGPAGSAAPATAHSGSDPAQQGPVISVPKKQAMAQVPHHPVVVAPDLDVTLPPMAERGEPREVAKVERDAQPVGDGPLERPRSRHRPLAAVALVLGAATIYAVLSGLSRARTDAVAPTTRSVPAFLREAPPATSGSETPLVELPASPHRLPAVLGEPDAGADGETGCAEPSTGARSAPAEAPVTPRATNASGGRARKLAASPHSTAPEVAQRSSNSSPSALRVENPPPLAADGDRFAPVRPVTTYTYADRALFAVATAPLRVTDIALEPGEKLVSRPTAGDAARWVIQVLDSVVRGEPQQHVFVKPLRARLLTNLTLTTTRRSYFLELRSSDDGRYMAAVQWQYPLEAAARRRRALAAAERERQKTTQISDLNALRFDYRIQVTAGAPDWKPTMVFDDGGKTFIRFPRSISASRAPLLFVLRSGKATDVKYINYRVKNDLYVVDRLIDTAELRLAATAKSPARNQPALPTQDVVRITRK